MEERAKVCPQFRVALSRPITEKSILQLLQFVSGSSRVPLEGFGALQGMSGVTKFSITSAGDTLALPTARQFAFSAPL